MLRKLQYDLGTDRVVAAMHAAGVHSLDAVSGVLRMMHEHEYDRHACQRDRCAWELLPALLAPSLTGGDDYREPAESEGECESENPAAPTAARPCGSLRWTGEALRTDAEGGGSTLEEVLGDLMARTRTLGFEALLTTLNMRWTVPRATTFLAAWFVEVRPPPPS